MASAYCCVTGAPPTMIFTFSRNPAAWKASTVVFIDGMVTVSSAESATRLAWRAVAASMKRPGATSAPRSITSKPPPSSIDATRFFPMSCRSPFTVPITTRPTGSAPAASNGRTISIEAFMARAESSISGTKYSSHSKSRPTSSMAGTRHPTMVSGATPLAMAACVTAAAAFQSPSITAWCSFSRSGMRNSIEFMHGIQHGDDVLHRSAGLQVVDRIEHEPAAGREDLAAAQHFLPHLLRRTERQGLLGIHASAPEHQARTILALQFGRIHTRRRTLHRVDDIEPGLDEALKEPLHAATGMFETLPGGIGVHPAVDALVVGEPQFAKGRNGAERRGLRAEIGAADEHAVHRVADAGVDARQVLHADFALALEDAVDVAAPRARRHVPLGDVADAFGVLQKRRGHQRDVAESRAAERRRHTVAAPARGAHGALDMVQVRFGNGGELFQVVRRVELLVVDLGLPDDAVEEGAAQGHAPARRRRSIALGIDQDVAVRLRPGPEIAGHQHIQAAEIPLFPARGGKAEHRLAREHAGDVESHRRAQIVLHQAQHLVGLVHLHRPRGQPVVVAQRRHATDVNAGYRGAPKIQRNPIRLAVFQGSAQPVPRSDAGVAQQAIYSTTRPPRARRPITWGAETLSGSWKMEGLEGYFTQQAARTRITGPIRPNDIR